MCDHGRDGGGTDVGKMAGIGEQDLGLAGLGRAKEHHAVAGGQTAGEVSGEGAGDLEREILAAAAVAGFDVDLARLRLDVEVHGHGGVALAAGVGDEGVAHAGDDLGIHQGAADFGKLDDSHLIER
jgi:hypothetical protein